MSKQKCPDLPTDIFLSYAHEDRKVARQLAESLTIARGWSIWWDYELTPGDRFSQEIQRIVTQARCVIVIWSKHSIESDWVIAEVSEGWERRVLFPVCIDDAQAPMPFRQIHASNLSDWNGSASAGSFLRLVEDVQRVISRGPEIGDSQLAERKTRMRRMRLKIWLRRLALVSGVAALGIVIWLAFNFSFQNQEQSDQAEAIAGQSNMLIANLLGDHQKSSRTWWAFLMTDAKSSERFDQLEIAALLALEAYKKAKTPVTETALSDAWSLLPWSDTQIKFKDDEHYTNLDFSFDGQFIAVGGGFNHSVILNSVSKAPVASIDHGNALPVPEKQLHIFDARKSNALQFSPSELILATAGPDDTVRLWNVDAVEQRVLKHSAAVIELSFSGDGTLLAASDKGNEVIVWDVATGNSVHRIHPEAGASTPVFSPKGTYLGTTATDGTVTIWSVDSGEPLTIIQHNPDWGKFATGINFSPDETQVVTYGYRRATVFHDLTNGKVLWRIDGGSYGGVLFSLDGSRVVVSGAHLGWYDTAHQTLLFEVEDANVLDIFGSPDGNLIGTVDNSSTVQLWDFATGRELKRIPFYRWNTSLDFTPDSTGLAMLGYDEFLGSRVLEFINVRPENLPEKVCSGISRNLNRSEWRDYFPAEDYRTTCVELGKQD